MAWMEVRYDKSTDSLYIEVRPLPSHRTVEIEEDIMLDIGIDGEPVGYDIQHASTKEQFIGRSILDWIQVAVGGQITVRNIQFDAGSFGSSP